MTNRDAVWVHGVSVGEANLALKLTPALQERLPNHKFVLSATTSTGLAVLRGGAPQGVSTIYFPLDRRKAVQRALGVVHPEVMVLVEAELWPNMLWGLARRGVPVVLANARISERSFKRYKAAGFLFRDLFAGLYAVGAQTPEDAGRLIELGCRPEAVRVAGALKFEAAGVAGPLPLDARELMAGMGASPEARVLVAGSTHAGEEVLLARVASRLRNRHPKLLLVLVPRHHERGAEVGRELASMGVPFEFRSNAGAVRPKRELECLVVNTTGELKSFYACADIVFMGKSLTAKGGQNPIEPAALGKPVVFGPYMDNFADVVRRFKAAEAAVEVADEAALEEALDGLLTNPGAARNLGAKAKRVVDEAQGALRLTADMVESAAAHVARRRARQAGPAPQGPPAASGDAKELA